MKAKTLVVEDSPSQRNELVRVLRERGFEVTSAAGGLEALAMVNRDPPDVVLLDVVLDGMDGYSVCRWLRLGESTRDVVVIMLTSKSEVKERVEGLHVGADDYVPKPFDFDELEARIFAALRGRNARLELRKRNADLEGLLSRTEQLAMTDALTGIFNRRRFVDMLGREFASARRYHHPLSLMLFDLDGFKRVNDLDGHTAGDDTLATSRGSSRRRSAWSICAPATAATSSPRSCRTPTRPKPRSSPTAWAIGSRVSATAGSPRLGA